jgi:hypothetical protein
MLPAELLSIVQKKEKRKKKKIGKGNPEEATRKVW